MGVIADFIGVAGDEADFFPVTLVPCGGPTFFRSAARDLHVPAKLTPQPTKPEARKRRTSERPRVGCCEELDGQSPSQHILNIRKPTSKLPQFLHDIGSIHFGSGVVAQREFKLIHPLHQKIPQAHIKNRLLVLAYTLNFFTYGCDL